MKLRLWGIRGSIPATGLDFVKYGGNTFCLEIEYGDGHRIIIDAGTGIKHLGDHLVQTELKKKPIAADLFISHTHWDHIMGFPFFVPIFIKGSSLNIHAPMTHESDSIEEVLGRMLSYRYFPVRQAELSADLSYRELREETLELEDGMIVRTKYLNHPVLCLGYRFEHNGKVFCTCYDNEPFRNVFPTDLDDPNYDPDAAAEGEEAAAEENRKIIDFYSGADLLIHDTQYTHKEYEDSKIGWGHSSYEYAINSAHKGGVKHLLLAHHDPLRTDSQLDGLLLYYRNKVQNKTTMKIDMAQEGMEIIV